VHKKKSVVVVVVDDIFVFSYNVIKKKVCECEQQIDKRNKTKQM